MEGLRDRTVQPGEEEAQGDPINAFEYVKGGWREDEARLFSLVSMARSNWHKVKHGRLHLNIRKYFCAVWVAEHWHILPREAMEPSPWTWKQPWTLCSGCLSLSRSWTTCIQRPLLTSAILWVWFYINFAVFCRVHCGKIHTILTSTHYSMVKSFILSQDFFTFSSFIAVEHLKPTENMDGHMGFWYMSQ